MSLFPKHLHFNGGLLLKAVNNALKAIARAAGLSSDRAGEHTNITSAKAAVEEAATHLGTEVVQTLIASEAAKLPLSSDPVVAAMETEAKAAVETAVEKAASEALAQAVSKL